MIEWNTKMASINQIVALAKFELCTMYRINSCLPVLCGDRLTISSEIKINPNCDIKLAEATIHINAYLSTRMKELLFNSIATLFSVSFLQNLAAS